MQTPSIMKLLENICWSYGIWSGKQRIWEAEGLVSREMMPLRSGVSVLLLVPENLLEESLVTTRMGWVRAWPGVRGKAAFTHAVVGTAGGAQLFFYLVVSSGRQTEGRGIQRPGAPPLCTQALQGSKSPQFPGSAPSRP